VLWGQVPLSSLRLQWCAWQSYAAAAGSKGTLQLGPPARSCRQRISFIPVSSDELEYVAHEIRVVVRKKVGRACDRDVAGEHRTSSCAVRSCAALSSDSSKPDELRAEPTQ
jgi:hypothetical protein